ncbi:MAG: 50S ribosomal protein L9 [Gammaproteobacteria bacterium]|nr:50S ribosomal protein L9 [Gammaproteobacteria bacterium]MXX95045.1 50S ribosomal protein L9 [Gammaproteobacteria bacterium]MYF53198.1 50S ribosomal protein L9 [Gammaproteobacteria bacterium]MYK43487.1 50S ribosomal protein L9 [Gammaproteobacteria bacterium]
MNVLLLERVANLGDLGDEVKVKNGFARNYLIPRGLALKATPDNRKIFEDREAELREKAIAKLQGAEQRAAQLTDLTLTILQRSLGEGRLYGSVGPLEISKELVNLGIEVHKSEIRMPSGVIRETGEYDIDIHIHADVSRTIHVIVEAS